MSTVLMKKAPEDPKDQYYLKVCFVCQEIAKEGESHSPHYGGVVCLTCRAFFRRSITSSRISDFKCKRKGNCKINLKTRRKCQKCRFEKCLLANMSPDAVLTDDQKKIRFRRLLEKKRLLLDKGNDPTSSTSTQSISNVQTSEEDDLSNSINYESIDLQENNSEPIVDFPSTSNGKQNQNFDLEVQLIVAKLRSTFHQSKLSNFTPNLLFEKLSAFHCGENSILISSEDFYSGIRSISEQFRLFALLQKDFTTLSQTDQEKLLQQNSFVYVHFCLALYLGSKSAQEQTAIIDYIYLPRSTFEQKASCQVLFSLEDFQRLTHVFKFEYSLEYYRHLIKSLRTFSFHTIDKIPIAAHFILFGFGPNEHFKDVVDFQDVSRMKKKLFDFFIGKNLLIEDLFSILTKIASFANSNITFVEKQEKNAVQSSQSIYQNHLIIPYTHDEEVWLHRQFANIDRVFKSVSGGSELMQEFVMFSVGVPLAADHIPRIFAIFLERIWRTFQIHEEFEDLPIPVQLDLVGNNSPAGLALIVVKSENCSSALEQIQLGFGESDDKRWEEIYLPLFPPGTMINKLTMRDMQARQSVNVSSQFLQDFYNLIDDSAFMVEQPWIYKMSLLLTLTHPGESGNGMMLNCLHAKYLNILRRRLTWILSTSDRVVDPMQEVSKILFGIENLQKLAPMLVKMMSSE